MAKRKVIDTTKNRIVGYCRFSSENQTENSIMAQQRAIEEYCKKHSYIIINWYIDRAKSATTDDRPEFQNMIKDSKKGEFDFVIIHKIDRFARNQHDYIVNEILLEKNGVKILSVAENIDDSLDSQFLKGMLILIAERYSKALGLECLKGLKENAHNGKHTGGFPPLGFDVDKVTKKYIINQNEAETVKLIFKMYTDGYGYKQIMQHINALGLKTKFGKKFGANSLHTILRNEKYCGTMVYNTKKEKGSDGKRRPTYKNPEDVIRVEDVLPQIICKEMFDKAQIILEKNLVNGGRFKAQEVYLLSGLGYCGECGSALYGNSRYCGRGKTKYVTYRCSGRAQHKGCKNKEMNKIYIENFVLDELYTKLFDSFSVQKLSNLLTSYNATMQQTNKKELETATAQLKATGTEMENLIELATSGTNGVAFKTIQKKLNELEEQREYLENYIKELNTNEALQISEAMVNELIERSKGFIRTKNITECRMFIESYIDKVLLYHDKVEVYFKIRVPNKDGELVPLVSTEGTAVLLKDYKIAR